MLKDMICYILMWEFCVILFINEGGGVIVMFLFVGSLILGRIGYCDC